MKRYQPNIENGHIHELLVVGGGIYGASMAYTAAINGIDVALFERDDFACHASANSQKVIHGGIRYLQSFDLMRVIESIREKHRFYKLFPHQVKPLPCLLPTKGYGTQGNEAFRAAFFFYLILEKWLCRKSRRKVIAPKLLSKEQVVHRFPHLHEEKIRGGALWYDGICVEPERVILSLLQSVVQCGGKVANYMKVTSFSRQKNGLFLVDVKDVATGAKCQVYTKKIALCTGAWFKEDFGGEGLPKVLEKLSFIRGMNLLVPSLFSSETSLATKVKGAAASRFLFVVPWKKYSIEGTYWEDCDSPESRWSAHREKAVAFHALHQSVLGRKENKTSVFASHVGCVPGSREEGRDVGRRILSHYLLVDREVEERGDVLQVVGVKFTTAFDVAFKALKSLCPKINIRDTHAFSTIPWGSPRRDVEEVKSELWQKCGNRIDKEQYGMLFQLFGTELEGVFTQYIEPLCLRECCSDENFYRGVTRYCIEQEMVLHLDDLVWRRLFPDFPEPISERILGLLADEMTTRLGWTEAKRENEILAVKKGRGVL